METDVFSKIIEIQNENKSNFTMQIQHEIFKLLDNVFVTMPLVPGILNEPYQRPPILYNNDSSKEEYKKYKERGQKYKALHYKCKGWNQKEILTSYPIDFNTDKIGGCTGNKSRNNKLSYIVVDIDNFTTFKNNAYGNLDVSKWPPTLISLSGGGCHLYYLVNQNSIELKSKSLIESLGIEIIANGKYNVLPGSVHPMAHTIYTLVEGFISPYLPKADLNIAPAPEIILKIITNEYDVNINSKKYLVENEKICNISEYLYKPKPIILYGHDKFVNLNNLNDLVSQSVPNYDDIKFCYNDGSLGNFDVVRLNDILHENEKLKTIPTENAFESKAMNIKPSILIQNKNDTSINNTNNQNTSQYQNHNINSPTDEKLINIDSKLKSLPKDIYDLIVNPPNIDRSSENQKVIVFLLDKGWTDDEIKHLFYQYPIGQKNSEKNNNDKYFETSLYNAKKYLDELKLKKINNSNTINNEEIENYGCTNMLDIYNNSNSPEYIINKILSRREKLLLVGGYGCLKSTFILQLCIELLDVNNKLLCNHYQINDEFRPKRILYLNGENSDDQLKNKLLRLLSGYSTDDTKNILSNIITLTKNNICDFYDDFDNESFIEYIIKTIDEYKIDLVIFDNFSCYNSNGKDENSNSVIRPKLNKVSFISSKFEIPAIVVHHSGKGKKDNAEYASRGATAFIDWATLVLWIKKDGDNNDYILKMIKSRNEELDSEVNLRYEGKKIFCPHGQFNSNSNYNNNLNKPDKITILINAIKNHNGVYDTQQQLIIDLSKELLNNNLPHSPAKCKKIIEEAKSLGILIESKGQNNSSILKLNNMYNS